MAEWKMETLHQLILCLVLVKVVQLRTTGCELQLTGSAELVRGEASRGGCLAVQLAGTASEG